MSAAITNCASRIVVGVDGSASSRTALRWAVRQANLTNGTVDAVLAWEIPIVLQSYNMGPSYVDQDGGFEENAKKTIEAVISEEVGPADSQRVRSLVIGGHPARVLLDVAAGADLLVVGSRGHGEFAGALLGSVSQNCAHHASCPVLIMHGESGQSAL
jgi:nucleotide-binding universal stress UspA family protein